MIEYYLQIKQAHVACVIASGVLFALRGILVLTGRSVGNHPALRYLSYAIDTTLLTAALMLVAVLHLRPSTAPWLTVKLLLLPVYVVLGVFALRRARTPQARALCFAAALLVFLFMFSVARYHHPLGVFALL